MIRGRRPPYRGLRAACFSRPPIRYGLGSRDMEGRQLHLAVREVPCLQLTLAKRPEPTTVAGASSARVHDSSEENGLLCDRLKCVGRYLRSCSHF